MHSASEWRGIDLLFQALGLKEFNRFLIRLKSSEKSIKGIKPRAQPGRVSVGQTIFDLLIHLGELSWKI